MFCCYFSILFPSRSSYVISRSSSDGVRKKVWGKRVMSSLGCFCFWVPTFVPTLAGVLPSGKQVAIQPWALLGTTVSSWGLAAGTSLLHVFFAWKIPFRLHAHCPLLSYSPWWLTPQCLHDTHGPDGAMCWVPASITIPPPTTLSSLFPAE